MSRNVSYLGQQADVQYMKEGPAPLSGVFKSDGKIFIGRYHGTWGSESVAPYQKKITRPGKTIIIIPLTDVLIVAAGEGAAKVVKGMAEGVVQVTEDEAEAVDAEILMTRQAI